MAVRKVSNNNKECDVIQDYELKVIYIYIYMKLLMFGVYNKVDELSYSLT